MEKGFVNKNEKNGDIFYYLDTEKLSKALENDDNFIYDSYLFTLAKNLVYQQEKEILLMKNMI